MGDGPPCFRRDFPCPAVLRIRSGGNEVSTTGLSPSLAGRSRPVRLPRSFLTPTMSGPTTPRGTPLGLGCSRFARRYSGNRVCFLLLRVLRCFSSPGVPSMPYGFRHGYCPITDSGFPHSDISGSTLAYSSPERFGVCPVLHRLLVPRHPPCALSSLTYSALGFFLCVSGYLVFKERSSSFEFASSLVCVEEFGFSESACRRRRKRSYFPEPASRRRHRRF